MLFGRKNSPIGSPKPVSADTAVGSPPAPATPDRGFADTTAPLSMAPAQAAPASPGSAASPMPAAANPSAPMPSPAPAAYRSPYADKGPEMTTSTPKPPIAPSIPGAGLRTDTPRRVVDIPGAPVRRSDAGQAAPAAAPAAQDQQRRLTVGRDISLSGEITSCDVLVVEGNVEAKLRDGRNIEIAETGLFKGSVEIDEADIAGRFEGDITVRGRLRVRSTGKITGSIKYGELEVEAGGRLVGDIQVVEPGANVARIATPAPAPVELPVATAGGAAE